jgi:hypothetical protein
MRQVALKQHCIRVYLIMPPKLDLPLLPLDVTNEETLIDAVCMVHNRLNASVEAVYGQVDAEHGGVEAFIARNPTDALRWICKRVSRPMLVRIIQGMYDYPDNAMDADNEAEASPTSTSKKRKKEPKETTTKQANAKMAQRLAETVSMAIANTQDWKSAKTPMAGISNEAIKYLNFLTTIPKVGAKLGEQMVINATAVATMEVFRDWAAIFTVWTEQHRTGKRLFEAVHLPISGAFDLGTIKEHEQDALLSQVFACGTPSQFTQHDMLQLHPQRNVVDEVGLTFLDTESFKLRFVDARKTQVDTITGDMRHRWKMDALYEDYLRLQQQIRRKSKGTGERGRRYETIAREHLFAKVYSCPERPSPTKEEHPEVWATFTNFLEWGKRWNLIKTRFGSVGIFGLLPRSQISNAFVEKQLTTQALVSQWVEMIAECNRDASALALHIEPLFLACMEQSEPPKDFAFLVELADLRVKKPLQLFEV